MSRLSDLTLAEIVPPCAGKWDLFDSTDLADHEEAVQLCAACPMKLECRIMLETARAVADSGGRPTGTWAGTLVGSARVKAERMAVEEAMFTDEQALAAHRAHKAGRRDKQTRIGERVYERRRTRRARAARAAKKAAA